MKEHELRRFFRSSRFSFSIGEAIGPHDCKTSMDRFVQLDDRVLPEAQVYIHPTIPSLTKFSNRFCSTLETGRGPKRGLTRCASVSQPLLSFDAIEISE